MVFFIGAVIMFFSVGVCTMGQQIIGTLLLIAGLVVVMISFSFTRIFMMYDMMHMTDCKRKSDDDEDGKGHFR